MIDYADWKEAAGAYTPDRNARCVCGRPYWRHFDGWNGNPWIFTEAPQCSEFRPDRKDD